MRIVFSIAIVLLLSGAFSPASAAVFDCKPTEVATFANRIHVRCATAAPGGFTFFAAPTANAAHAARLLSVALAAHIAAKTLAIGYDPADTSGTAFGCAAGDCRRIVSLTVR